MLKEAIGTGNTIDEAKENAIMLLGAKPEDVVNIEVLQNAKKKSLGIFGGALAKVKASMEVEDVVEEPVEVAKKETKKETKAQKETKIETVKEEINGVPYEELKDGTVSFCSLSRRVSRIAMLRQRVCQYVVWINGTVSPFWGTPRRYQSNRQGSSTSLVSVRSCFA